MNFLNSNKLFFFTIIILSICIFFTPAIFSSFILLIIYFNNYYHKQHISNVIIFYFIILLSYNLEFGLSSDSFKFVSFLVFLIFSISKFFFVSIKSMISILPFVIVSLIITVYNNLVSLDTIARILSFPVIIFITYNYISKSILKDISKFAILLLTVYSFINGISLILSFIYPEIFFKNGYFKSIFGNPNEMAICNLFILILLKGLIIKGVSISDRLIYVTYFILLICIFISGSRIVIGGSILFFVLYYIYVERKKINFIKYIYCSIFISVIILIYSDYFSNLFINTFELDSENFTTGRSDVWLVIWENIQVKPFFGYGFKYDTILLDEYRSRNNLYSVNYYGIWNSYLSLLLYSGIVGTFLYFSSIYYMISKTKFRRFILIFILISFITATVESWMISPFNFSILIMLLILALFKNRPIKYEKYSFSS